MVAKMMGDKGSIVHSIEEQTHCHLQFSPRGDFYPDTRLRILVVISQEAQQVFEALSVVVDQIASRAADEGRPASGKGGKDAEFTDSQGRILFKCALSKAAAGAIIGSKGERIRQLREQTSAMIDIDRDVVDNHQRVTVAGTRDQILQVVEELNTTVQNDAHEGWFQEWAAQRSVSADAGAGGRSGPPSHRGPPDRGPGGGGGYRDRPRDRGGAGGRGREEHRINTIFVGRLSQATNTESLRAHFEQYGEIVDADVRVDTSTNRSKGFGFITFADPNSVEAALEAKSDHHIDGRWVDVQRYGENGPGGGDDGGHHEDVRRDDPPPRASERERDYRDRDDRHARSNGAWAAGGGEPNSQRGPDWLARLADRMNPEYLTFDYCITCSLPSAKCGALIGRGGQHVGEVQKETGAVIEISKKDPNEGPDAHRTITITGPLLSVYGAHLLLMRHYNEEEAHYQAAQQREPGRIEEMKRQLAALQDELERVQGGGGRAGGRGPAPSSRAGGGGGSRGPPSRR